MFQLFYAIKSFWPKKKLQEELTIKGWWTVVCRDINGDIEWCESGPNLITNAGRNLAASLFIAGAGTAYDSAHAYIEVGTGAATTSVADTALNNVPDATFRKAATASRVNNILTFTASYPTTTDAVGTITELGLFNASSGGTMFNHFIFGTAQPKSNSSTLTVTLTVTF